MQNAVWGNRYKDWTDIQEERSKDGYQFVLDTLSLHPSVTLLDVGCGTGFFCKLASDRGATVTGIDATPVFIDEAKLRLPNASFVLGNMETLPFEEGSFGVVCGFNSFQYASDIETALAEAKRVLAPRGKLVIMIWGKKEDCECAGLLKAIATLLPSATAENAGPFALSENHLIEQILLKIGFRETKVTDIPSAWDYPDGETAVKGLMALGAVSKAIERVGTDKVEAVIRSAVQPHLQKNGHIVYYNKYRIIMAER